MDVCTDIRKDMCKSMCMDMVKDMRIDMCMARYSDALQTVRALVKVLGTIEPSSHTAIA